LSGRWFRRRRATWKTLRIAFEFLQTADAAEMVARALVLKRPGAAVRIDQHPAHRVDDFTTQGGDASAGRRPIPEAAQAMDSCARRSPCAPTAGSSFHCARA